MSQLELKGRQHLPCAAPGAAELQHSPKQTSAFKSRSHLPSGGLRRIQVHLPVTLVCPASQVSLPSVTPVNTQQSAPQCFKKKKKKGWGQVFFLPLLPGFVNTASPSSTMSLKTVSWQAHDNITQPWGLHGSWQLSAPSLLSCLLAATAPLAAPSRCQGPFLHLKQARSNSRNCRVTPGQHKSVTRSSPCPTPALL